MSLLLRPVSLVPAATALALGLLSLVSGRQRAVLLAVALFAAGWWWGSVRLETLDRSALVAHVGQTRLAQVEVTGPGRESEFALRVPVRVVRFGDVETGEPARLELPPGRSPPQGALLELVAAVRLPRPPDAHGAFDEAAYLKRQGIHVVLHAERFRVVGRRGGMGGVADSLRRAVARSLDLGLEGERRAVVAAVVLGEDEGLDRDLRERFRSSGLYHLLSVDIRGRTTAGDLGAAQAQAR